MPSPVCPWCGQPQIRWRGYPKRACVLGHGLKLAPRPAPSERPIQTPEELEDEQRVAKLAQRSAAQLQHAEAARRNALARRARGVRGFQMRLEER